MTRSTHAVVGAALALSALGACRVPKITASRGRPAVEPIEFTVSSDPGAHPIVCSRLEDGDVDVETADDAKATWPHGALNAAEARLLLDRIERTASDLGVTIHFPVQIALVASADLDAERPVAVQAWSTRIARAFVFPVWVHSDPAKRADDIGWLVHFVAHELGELAFVDPRGELDFGEGPYGSDWHNRVFGEGIAEYVAFRSWKRCRELGELAPSTRRIEEHLAPNSRISDDDRLDLSHFHVSSSVEPACHQPDDGLDGRRYAAAFRVVFEASERDPRFVEKLLRWIGENPRPKNPEIVAEIERLVGPDIAALCASQRWGDVKACLRRAYGIETQRDVPSSAPVADTSRDAPGSAR